MASRSVLYGVVAVLMAAIVVTSSLAVMYYYSAQQQRSDSNLYSQELTSAIDKYNSLVSSYSTSLSDYRATMGLLANALGGLNTSSSSYKNASLQLASLWASYLALVRQGGGKPIVYTMDMLVSYGNGTQRWYNDSETQPGWNAYIATLVLLKGDVQATLYTFPGYPPEHFVEALNNVSETSSTAWFIWTYSGGAWQTLSTGADELQVQNGTIIAWTLCSYDQNYAPQCTP